METEIWKLIEDYPSYSVSSLGQVRNNSTGRVLKPAPNTFGYLQVVLYNNGKKKSFTIHSLVAKYFIPSGEGELNHIDENKLNNRWDNLEWVTHKDNCNHGTRNRRMGIGLSKPVAQFDLEGNKIREFVSASEVQRVYGYWQTVISSCCLNKIKTAYGFKWQFI